MKISKLVQNYKLTLRSSTYVVTPSNQVNRCHKRLPKLARLVRGACEAVYLYRNDHYCCTNEAAQLFQYNSSKNLTKFEKVSDITWPSRLSNGDDSFAW